MEGNIVMSFISRLFHPTIEAHALVATTQERVLEPTGTDLASQRVYSGALLLDQKVPGWERRIIVRDLIMWSPMSCILGQLFEDHASTCSGFQIGLHELKLSDRELVRYGFVDDYAHPVNAR